MASIYATTKGFNELWHKVTKERETLDKFKKKIPPFIIDNNVALTYTLGIEYYSEILAELNTIKNEEMEDWVIDVFPSLYAGIDSLISDMKELLANYESELKKNKVIPSEKPAGPPAQTPPTNTVIPSSTPPATQAPPTNTTPTISEKNTEGGPKVKDSHTGETSLAPTEKKEVSQEGTPKTEAPKKGFFTPTNIVILFLLFGAGVYFYNQKK